MRVLKFDLELRYTQKIKMPLHSDILAVQYQRGKLRLWAACPESPMTERKIAIVGTGNVMPDGELVFVGTVQQHGGDLVWHVFEIAD